MSYNALMIARAILDLKQESSVFKDFVFPLISTVVSVLMGYYISQRSFEKQEKLKAELEKVNRYNSFVVGMDGVLQSLIGIKSIYRNRLDDDPWNRLVEIPKIKVHLFTPPEVSSIVFLAYANEYQKGHPVDEGWNNLPRFNKMLGNYSQLNELIQRRNNLKESLIQIVQQNEDNQASIDITEFIKKHSAIVVPLIDTTEALISKVDGLLQEVNSCVHNLHLAANKSIDNEKIKKYTHILTYKNENDDYEEIIKPSVTVNYLTLSSLLGITEEKAKNLYKNGYEEVNYPKSK